MDTGLCNLYPAGTFTVFNYQRVNPVKKGIVSDDALAAALSYKKVQNLLNIKGFALFNIIHPSQNTPNFS